MNNVISALKKSNNVAIFSHVMPDGDAFGSSLALKDVLNNMGKKADVYIVSGIPERLKFLSDDFKTEFEDLGYDTYIALDCGDLNRLSYYSEDFKKAENTVSIDHHFTNLGFAKINYVVSDACSTAEVLFDIFENMNINISKRGAEFLYSALASDTGCFKFSNTRAKGHIIASKLIEKGIDFAEINRLMFDTEDEISYKLKGYAMSKVKLFADGKIASVKITKEDLKKLGAEYEHTEALSDIVRIIKGVEAGFVLKEKDDAVKVSIRTNRYMDATLLAGIFGGGGHIRASGCTSDKGIDETEEILVSKAKELIKD